MNLLFWYRSLMRSVGAALVKLIATATSGLVSFTTNVIRPVKVTCEFSPIQDGIGDPSPDNVRPISGWTGCEIHHASNNILGSKGSDRLYPTFIPKGVTVNASHKSTANNTIRYYRKDKTQVTAYFIQGTADAEGYKSMSYTATEDIYWVKFDRDTEDQQLNFGSTRLPYNEPQAATLPITFTDPSTGDPLTVYGGTVTLNEDGSVDLLQTMAIRDASQLGFARFSSTYADPDNNIYGPALRVGSIFKDSGRVETAYSNVAKSGSGKTGHNFQIASLLYLSIYSPTPLTTGAEALAYLESIGFYVVGTLNEPVTYHFDNIGQLQSFLGTNNIWHNMNGSITAEYYKKQ